MVLFDSSSLRAIEFVLGTKVLKTSTTYLSSSLNSTCRCRFVEIYQQSSTCVLKSFAARIICKSYIYM